MNPSSGTVLRILVVTSAYLALLLLAWMARAQLIWIGIAFFFAVALSPAVQRIPTARRGTSVLVVFGAAVVIFLLLGAAVIPPLVAQSESLGDRTAEVVVEMQTTPWMADLLHRFNVPDSAREQQEQLFRGLSGAGLSLLDVGKSLFGSLAATVTILGLTVFMLLEGPTWIALFMGTQTPSRRERIDHVAGQMYRAVTGYVTGNLLTSVIAGVAAAIVMAVVGVPYVVPLAVLVAVLDLVPLVGATLGALVVILVALFQGWVVALIMLAFFVVYQQLENHVLQPLVYGRTVQMSPLLVLVSVLIGASLAGIVGALVAIPVAASVQILIRDLYTHEFSAVGTEQYVTTGLQWLHPRPPEPTEVWWGRRTRRHRPEPPDGTPDSPVGAADTPPPSEEAED